MTAEPDTDAVRPAFDEVVHAPLRMRICGLLSAGSSLSFAHLRDALGVSDAVCSKQLKVLAEHGYVTLEKYPANAELSRYPSTWVSITGTGKRAFRAHLAELQRIASGL